MTIKGVIDWLIMNWIGILIFGVLAFFVVKTQLKSYKAKKNKATEDDYKSMTEDKLPELDLETPLNVGAEFADVDFMQRASLEKFIELKKEAVEALYKLRGNFKNAKQRYKELEEMDKKIKVDYQSLMQQVKMYNTEIERLRNRLKK